MLSDGCSSRTVALCFCLVWLMYFALMQINWPFFPPIHKHKGWLYSCLTAGVGRCLLFWQPASLKISLLLRLPWRSVHTHSAAQKNGCYPTKKTIILILIKCCTYGIRVAILRDRACDRESNWLQIWIKMREWGVHYSSTLTLNWSILFALPFDHNIWDHHV